MKVSRAIRYTEVSQVFDSDEGKVVKLCMSVFGTRDAAQNWTEDYTRHLMCLGFKVGHCELVTW